MGRRTSLLRPHYLEPYQPKLIRTRALRCTECLRYSINFNGDNVRHKETCSHYDPTQPQYQELKDPNGKVIEDAPVRGQDTHRAYYDDEDEMGCEMEDIQDEV